MHKPFVRPVLTGANTEFSLFAAKRVVADAADARPKSADFFKELFAKYRIPAVNVPHIATLSGHPPVRTTDGPVELPRQPARSPTGPNGKDSSSYAKYGWVSMMLAEPRQPVRCSDGIVIEKCYEAAFRSGDTGISRSREAGASVTFDSPHSRHFALSHSRHFPSNTARQGLVVVDDDNDLGGR
jgi:hypothetical protein